MGLSLVRCPFCDRRYNVTGIPPGTRVLCTSCRTVLTVPGNRFVAPPPFWHRFVPRSGAAQLTSALFGGLILAAASFMAFKEAYHPAVVSFAAPNDLVKAPGGPSDVPTMAFSPTLKTVLSEFENDPSRFEIYTSEDLKPFILIGERNEKADLPVIFSQFEDVLPKLYRTFMKEFGQALKLERIVDAELPIVFYTKRRSYDDWWRRIYGSAPFPEVYGVFSYLERRVSLYYDLELDTIDAGRTREVLLHEAIHQLVDHYTHRRTGSHRHGSWWFQEGLGCYFEGFYFTPGEVTLTPGKMTSRLPLARELLASSASEYQPLQKLIIWDVDSIWSDWLVKAKESERKRQVQKLQCHYAQAWSFVNFLCHEDNGKYRPFFLEYFQSELQGKGGFGEFERLLSLHHGLDVRALEKQFIDYLRKL